jgi:hypothetical protein
MLITEPLFAFDLSPKEKAKIDFKKVNDTYLKTNIYSLDILYNVYDNHKNGNLTESKNGIFIKSNSNSYSKLLDIETIVTPEMTIVIDNDEKGVVVADTKKNANIYSPAKLDTLLNYCSMIFATDISSTKRFYTLMFEGEEQEMSRIDLLINLTNYRIEKIVFFYEQELPLNTTDYYAENKKPRLEILYNSFVDKNKLGEQIFSKNNYIQKSNDTYTPLYKYKSYELINQLSSYRFKKR